MIRGLRPSAMILDEASSLDLLPYQRTVVAEIDRVLTPNPVPKVRLADIADADLRPIPPYDNWERQLGRIIEREIARKR